MKPDKSENKDVFDPSFHFSDFLIQTTGGPLRWLASIPKSHPFFEAARNSKCSIRIDSQGSQSRKYQGIVKSSRSGENAEIRIGGEIGRASGEFGQDSTATIILLCDKEEIYRLVVEVLD